MTYLLTQDLVLSEQPHWLGQLLYVTVIANRSTKLLRFLYFTFLFSQSQGKKNTADHKPENKIKKLYQNRIL